MKIAVLTSGRLPVPATLGGAVETLVDMYLDYNERHGCHAMTVFGTKPRQAALPHQRHNRYEFVDTHSPWFRLEAKVRSWLHPEGYYDRWSELFLHKCLKRLKRTHYDCIILENRPGFALSLPQELSAHVIVHLGNDYLNTTTLLASAIKARCKGVIACSNYIRRRAEAVPAPPLSVPCLPVYNGIDVARFAQAQPASRASFGFTVSDFVVVYSGRLTAEKGILQLIKAMHMLNDMPEVRLLVIGASFYGSDRVQSPFLTELRRAALPLGEKIQFTGYVDYERIPSYLKLADVAVVPSTWEEPFGLTVAEAMAAGRALVATRSGAIPELCDGAALLVNRDNVAEELAKAIRRLRDHPSEANSLAQEASKRSHRFDKDIFSREFFNAIETICQT